MSFRCTSLVEEDSIFFIVVKALNVFLKNNNHVVCNFFLIAGVYCTGILFIVFNFHNGVSNCAENFLLFVVCGFNQFVFVEKKRFT